MAEFDTNREPRMSTLAKPGLLFLLAVLAPIIVLANPANVDAQTRPAATPDREHE